MAKISAKLFQVLRSKVCAKFPAPQERGRYDREVRAERAAWLRSEAVAKLKKMTPTQVKELAVLSLIGEDCDYKLRVDEDKFTPKQPADVNKAKRESLLKRIEKAELLSMAGDDAQALKLISEIVD